MRTSTIAGGTADAQITTGAVVLYGCSIRETVGTNPGQIVLRNGTTTGDPAVAYLQVPANSMAVITLPAVDCPNGVFADRGTGTTDIVIYVG